MIALGPSRCVLASISCAHGTLAGTRLGIGLFTGEAKIASTQRTGISNSGPIRTLASSVYSRLREDIIRCVLPPSEKIRIDALCLRYEVGSTTPIREALNRLSAEGLVKRIDQRGFQVAPVSRDDLLDLTRTRILLNEIALRDSMAREGARWEEELVVAALRLSRIPERIGPGPSGVNPAWDEQHKQFHCALIANSGSKLIEGFCASLFDQAARYRNLGATASLPVRDTEAEHRAIVDAVIRRDAELAVSLLRNHFTLTTDLVLSLKLDQVGEGENAAFEEIA